MYQVICSSSRRYLLPWKLMTEYSGVCGVMAKTKQGFPGITPKYPVIMMAGGIPTRYPLEEKHITCPCCNRDMVTNHRLCRSLKDDISKEIPPRLRSGLVFKGLRHLNLSQNTSVNTETHSVKPLKIRPQAMRVIDIVLKRPA